MASGVTFKVNIDVDDKGRLKSASIDVSKLKDMIAGVKTEADHARESLIAFNQKMDVVQGIANGYASLVSTLGSLSAETRQFGAAMAAANTMAGKGGEEFAKLKGEVADLAKQVPVARDELAQGLYQVISNGVPENNWITFLNQSARSAVGGIADLSEVVKVTSTVIKNYGLEWSDAQTVQDKIQLTAKNGVTSFEQLAQALPRVTANASTLGVSIDELMASFATLTGVSGNTAEVSTQLSAIFAALVKPSSEAAEMAQQMGIQFDAAAIKAAGGMKNFLTQLSSDVKRFSATSGMLEQEIYGKLFGSVESLRAINPLVGKLSDTFARNVDNMRNSAGTMDEAYEQMGNTGSAQLTRLKNEIASYMDTVVKSFTPLLPALNITAQLGMTLTSVMSLVRGIQTLGVATRATSAVVSVFGPIVQVCSASMRGAAVSATTLKLAIRGLMITTGVGVAVAALTTIIDHLAGSSNKAAASQDQLRAAQQRAQQAHEQEAQQIATVRSEMAASLSQLKSFKGSKEQEAKLVQQMNGKYGEAMGYYSSVAQWYKALTANSKTYCDQMINEIRLRSLANQAADLMQRQHDIKYNTDGSLRKYSTRNKTERKATKQVDTGDGKTLTVYENVEVEGTSQLAQANKQLTSLYRQQQNVRREMERIAATGGKLKMVHTEGYSPTAPTIATPAKGTGKTGTTVPHKTETKPEPLKYSIDWYEQEIQKLTDQLNASANETTSKKLQAAIEAKQRELGMLKIRLGIESVPNIEVKKETKHITQQIDDEIEKFKQEQKPIVIDVKMKRKLDDMESLQSLGSIDVSSFESVHTALANIKGITDPTGKSLATAASACQMLGGAMQQLGANSAAAKAGMVMAAVGQLVLSFAQAMTDASKNWMTWLAFGVSGTAQLMSIIGTISQFATGGIVGGNQKQGDRVLVRVNSGEMILNASQQARLFALASGKAVPDGIVANTSGLQNIIVQDAASRKLDINLKLRGRDLVAAVANETRSNSRRSNIKT